MEEVFISFNDENGVEHQYALIEELSVDESLYGVFAPVEEEGDLLVFRIEGDQLVEIESDEEFEKVREAWESLLDEEEEDEEE
jgi:putative Holliday junction resolvase